jgi:hypothetical protein
MKLTSKDFENYAGEMLTTMGEYLESTDKFKEKFEQSKENISPERINYCLEKFLHAEFDYQTAGNRGLGRMTEHWPRLAGYFRGAFSKLSPEKNKELDSLITGLIAKCYIFLILISDKPMEQSKLKTGEQLYEKWIPQIYTFDLSGMGDNVGNLLFALIEKDHENIKNFFKQNGMTPGFFGGDKTDEILNGYIAAGIVLRVVEKA